MQGSRCSDGQGTYLILRQASLFQHFGPFSCNWEGANAFLDYPDRIEVFTHLSHHPFGKNPAAQSGCYWENPGAAPPSTADPVMVPKPCV